jgi:hypothetical protein
LDKYFSIDYLETLPKRIEIWFWWNFGIKRDEFNDKLNLRQCKYNPICEKKILNRRIVAHHLDIKIWNVWNLPKQFVENF